MGFFREVWQHRQLVTTMAARAIKARYAGSVLGLAWAILEPLLQFALYLLVFGVFLGLRGLAGGGLSFSLWLLAGLSPFLLLQEGWVRAAGVFRSHAGLVKHVPVPLSVILASELAAVLARHAVILTLLVAVAGFSGPMRLTTLPILAAALAVTLAFLLGGSLLLAVAGTYLPDVAPVTSTLMGFALYLTPILYPEKLVPASVRPLLVLNPLAGVAALFRQGLGHAENLSGAAWALVSAVVALWLGCRFFASRQVAVRDLV
ncbi:MAG: ABC transporter permease [Thermoanaerobaculum sp.]